MKPAADVSSFTRLRPGDVIGLGTPGGVGARRTPPVYLKPGDIVEVAIAEVGRLSNVVTDDGGSGGSGGR